ncbi:MAG: hypothetical protein KF861_15535 [Planctomycetaceae bacterium]|nr:hypothetical protein [Planctomycetaceae bacterium]
MPDFDELAASRRQWIDEVLKPWCREASLKDLRRAEREWGDIAGRVDPQRTLWLWAWSRFPELVAEELAGFDETYVVTLTLRNGEQLTGYPDARRSQGHELVLVPADGSQGTTSILLDHITAVCRTASDSLAE